MNMSLAYILDFSEGEKKKKKKAKENTNIYKKKRRKNIFLKSNKYFF